MLSAASSKGVQAWGSSTKMMHSVSRFSKTATTLQIGWKTRELIIHCSRIPSLQFVHVSSWFTSIWGGKMCESNINESQRHAAIGDELTDNNNLARHWDSAICAIAALQLNVTCWRENNSFCGSYLSLVQANAWRILKIWLVLNWMLSLWSDYAGEQFRKRNVSGSINPRNAEKTDV